MKKLAAVFAVLSLAVAGMPAIAEEFAENTHYELITPPQPTSTTDKVEVVELFWYGCPHCYQFEPSLVKWLKTKPADVAFVRVPGIFRPNWAILGRAYYTAEALGVLDKIHEPLFAAVHELKRPMETEDQLAAFFAENGVKDEDFRKAFRSFAVETKVRRAMEMSQRYGARGVPTMIVNGKYRVSSSLPGVQTHANALKVVDYLVKKESGK
jgi:thiol:disulfide interchange protein DsbA